MRLQKKTDQALTELDRHLFQKPGVVRPECETLLIERASLWAAKERWEDAERDLDMFFRRVKPTDYPARFWTRACLARGFLHQRKDETEQAVLAWQRGLPKSHPHLAWAFDRICPMSVVQTAMLCSLCKELTDKDVELVTARLMAQMGGILQGTGVKATVQFLLPELAPGNTGPVLREMWYTQEGQRLAQQVAFRQRPMPELYRTILGLSFARLVQRMLLPHELTPDEDEVLRKVTNDLYVSAVTAKLSKKQLADSVQLGFLWRNEFGATTFLSFDGAAKSLDPEARAPMSFFFGLRYQHVHRNQKQATAYFNRALKLAAPDSQLERVARVALKSQKK